MKKIKGSLTSNTTRFYELVIICLVLFIVFFVLFAVYKNVGGLANVKHIDSMRSNYFHREGFIGTGTRPSLNYSSYPDNLPIDTKIPFLIDENKRKETKKNKVWGFQGLFESADTNEFIDPFYKAKSDNTCEGSGLTKENGNLCLDNTQRKLLTTRGGNSQYDSVIG